MRKNKGTIECNKSIITCDISTTQCEDCTIKYEKKIKKPTNVTKVQSYMILVLHNVKMVPSNVRKNKWTTECGKSTITCDVSTT